MPSALVTGASGFVGSHRVRELQSAGWKVLRAAYSGESDLTGDLLKIPLRGVSVDVVFHLAGFSSPQGSVDQARAAFDANAATTARLVREVRAGRFVIASTCQVYAPTAERATEAFPILPRTPYAASKLCSEALAFASGRDIVALRPYNHTGPGQSEDFVCPRIARQVALAEAGLAPAEVRVLALAPLRDFFDVRDMARAYRLAAERGGRGEVYNVATGRPISIGEIARRLLSIARRPLKLTGVRGVADVATGDSTRFRSATGWRPEIGLDRTLRDLLDHERSRIESPAAAGA